MISAPHFRWRVLAPLLLLLSLTLRSAPASASYAGPQDDHVTPSSHADLVRHYQEAVRDAQEMRFSKLQTHLTLINADNRQLQWKTIEGQKCVKVALFSDTFYDPYIGKALDIGPGRTTWVLVPADLLNWYRAHRPADSALLLRLRQLLGMPPDVPKTRIVEMWVRPEDIRRPSIAPAIDKEIDPAALFAQAGTDWFRPAGDDAYNTWFYRQCAESYVVPVERLELYPWTRLGYTYDWGNPQYPHVGLSEFIVWGGTGVKAWVESSKTPEEFFLPSISRKGETRLMSK